MARGGRKDDSAARQDAAGGFEQALARLEAIVGELEGSDVPLERALALFEEGVKLGRACTTTLDDAERRITMLLEHVDGTLAEKPFDASAAAASAGGASESAGEPARRAAAPSRQRAKPAAPSRASDDDDVPF